ncbi:alkyl hydroperoxide reductase AhpD [Streptomyces ruber]|uniref:Alkyl hydroperoxide reductase AhpD n=2 Tax=Streptomyces TaxID=1883 RepID=A0A918ES83_9ACTN|nr:peroxidase-related enzyme [Streptomyces ruber]GGQ52286.1 alkyl hydroperoxide reductase AhpD [Streptomyces ruber]
MEPTEEHRPVYDVIDRLAGDLPRVTGLRALRPRLVELQQRAHGVLFDDPHPDLVAGALAVAAEHRAPAAVAHYTALLGDDSLARAITEGADVDGRTGAAVAHARLLTRTPSAASREDIEALYGAGFTDAAVVTFSQAVAFVNQQLQLAAGLRLLAGGEPATGLIPTVDGGREFTLDVLTWHPFVRPIPKDELSEEHRRALRGKKADTPYFRTLGHDLAVLAERTAIDLAAFTSEGGLPRAERELAATAVSMHNGCVYCASVHARLAARNGLGEGPVRRLLAHGSRAVTGRRPNLVARFAAGLAPVPATATGGDVTDLRAAGLTDLELVDLVHCAAFFAWANRLMLSLGSHREPAA